ncbi:hypothetical protein BFN67_02425 [Pseudaminobacter manganicus]|jgi:hypothetical protein|uniref:DUF982 domain-containing protein n=2 Tax=Manganibacter manganicus TaxID=1873176 RepID=A0A1V8RRW8_9HYPH|nr:hypothetical protein BFN67_02425 [Pseudaminobacter manganicus]
MDNLQFEVPVRVTVTADMPIDEIYGVEQALDFLGDWPKGRQGKLYQTAFNACFGASVGVVSTEEACRAFAAFCRASGVMARDMLRPKKRPVAKKPSLH